MHQMQTGEGVHLKTSLYESAVAGLINQGSNYLNGGVDPMRMGNHHPNIVPYGLYQTKTLPIVICVGTQEQYRQLIGALDIEDYQKFSTNEARVANRR
jgi:formyl-CoA transferase